MASQTDTLARIYAQSLFDLADQAGGRDKILEIADELEQVCELLRSDRAFADYCGSPVIDTARRATGLRSIFTNRITDLVLRFMLVLNTNGRLDRFETIQTAFDQLVQEAWGRVEVDVWTASPMHEDTRSMLATRLHEILGKEPVLHPWVDDRIIGGVRIRIGDQLIDGSVAARLRQFERTLRTEGNHAISHAPETFLSVPEGERRFE